jgi:exopolysaccharide biosynthesis WecB/TagA/CpsF family protein
LVLALGHPKQEVLAAYLKKYQVASLRVVLCFGASVDFLIGEQIRAPKFLQQIGLEWFYRLATNPKKFLKRYSQAVWPSLVLIVSAVRARFF